MKKKILFLLISVFVLMGIVKAEDYPNYVIGKGETFQLEPTLPTGFSSTITYSTESPDCVTVTSDGKITGANISGTCSTTVTAKSEDDSVNETYSVYVVNKVVLHGNGGTVNCTYTKPDEFYSWYLENQENDLIARDDESSVLKQIFIHTDDYACSVTKDNSYFAGWYTQATGGELVSDTASFNEVSEIYAHWSAEPIELESIDITVGYKKEGIKIVAIHKDGTGGKRNEIQLNELLTPYYATVEGITWTSQNPEIATVNETGKVTAVSVGDAVIKAKVDGTNKESIFTVRVTEKDMEIVLIPDNAVIKVGEVIEYKIYQIGPLYPNSANGEATYSISISEGSIANFVDPEHPSAKIKGLKEGTVTITASMEGGTVSTSTTLKVEKDDGEHHIGTLKFMIKFEGGEGADANATMENQAVYDGETTTIHKNLFTKKGYVFAGWAVYIEKADGTRIAATVDGKQMMYKDGDDISKLNIPEGATLVLVATWVTNPNTGAIVPLTIVSLGLVALYLFFIKSKKFNKIANI